MGSGSRWYNLSLCSRAGGSSPTALVAGQAGEPGREHRGEFERSRRRSLAPPPQLCCTQRRASTLLGYSDRLAGQEGREYACEQLVAGKRPVDDHLSARAEEIQTHAGHECEIDAG